MRRAGTDAGCAVGTAKSRVFRARRQLEAWLLGEDKETGRSTRKLDRTMLLSQGPLSGDESQLG